MLREPGDESVGEALRKLWSLRTDRYSETLTQWLSICPKSYFIASIYAVTPDVLINQQTMGFYGRRGSRPRKSKRKRVLIHEMRARRWFGAAGFALFKKKTEEIDGRGIMWWYEIFR